MYLWVGVITLFVALFVVGCKQHKITVKDKTAPTVSISAPSDGARVSGTIAIIGSAQDPNGGMVAKVEVSIDSGNWEIATGTSSWSFNWNTSSVSDGAHTIQARATDLSGNTAVSAIITVNVDNTPPNLVVTSHSDGDYVKGNTVVTISGTATDPNGGTVSWVDVQIDNRNWDTASGTTNWSYNWNTSNESGGPHTVKVRASDSFGSTTTVSFILYVDWNSPYIHDFYPEGGASVPTGTNIYIRFTNGPIDRASVENNFRLVKSGTTEPVSGKFYWRDTDLSAYGYDKAEVCIFVPDDYLTDDKEYRVYLNGVKDRAGYPVNSVLNYTFRTIDCTPPEIASRVPDKDALLDPSDPGLLTLEFSEQMDWVEVELRNIKNNHGWTLPVFNSSTNVFVTNFYVFNGNIVEINDNNNQISNWSIGGAFKGINTDPEGKLYVELYNLWPTYINLYKSPSRNQESKVASGYRYGNGWFYFYPENNSGLSGYCYVSYIASDYDIELTLGFDSILQPDGCYRVAVEGVDNHGNKLDEEDSRWYIYTKQDPANDTNAPSVVDTLPADGATGITPRRLIHIVFSELIDPHSFSASDLTITDSSGSVSYQWEMVPDEESGLFTRLSILPNRKMTGNVTVTLKKDSITDLAGNKGPTSDKTFSFTVADDTTRPTVTWVLPADGTTDLDATLWIFEGGVCFSERMDGDIPSDALSVVDSASGAPIKGIILKSRRTFDSMLGGSSVMTITTSPKFAGLLYWDEKVDFELSLSENLKDLAGNTLGSSYKWTISTLPDSNVDSAPEVFGYSLDDENVHIEVFSNGNMHFEFEVAVRDNDNWNASQGYANLGEGDGKRTVWTGYFDMGGSGCPIKPGSVIFYTGGLRAWDDSNGNFFGDATGTINYDTGYFKITWEVAPWSGYDIYAQYCIGGLDVFVECGTSKWRLSYNGGHEYRYETYVPNDEIGSLYNDPQKAPYGWNNFTFTIKDQAGHMVTFTKQVYIPDPTNIEKPISPDWGDGLDDRTPTFSWTAPTFSLESAANMVAIGSFGNGKPTLFYTSLSKTSFTLPEESALDIGQYFWLTAVWTEGPAGDGVQAFGVNLWFEKMFWIEDTVNYGVLAGVINVDPRVSERDYVFVFVEGSSASYLTLARYNAAYNNYEYIIRDVSPDDYIVGGFMDRWPYYFGDEINSEDVYGHYTDNPPEPTDVTVTAGRTTKVDFTIYAMPEQVRNPTPANGATNVPVTTELQWEAAEGAFVYLIYAGGSPTNLSFIGWTTELYFEPTPGYNLPYSSTIYWRVDAMGLAESLVKEGEVWSFTTEDSPGDEPEQVVGPEPSDGATGVDVSVILHWLAASGAEEYDVYFGTNYDAVNNADQSSSEYMGSLNDLRYGIGGLSNGATYYWRIDSVNSHGTKKGTVWSFTTAP